MYSLKKTADGFWIITHPRHPGLAWSNEAPGWVPRSTWNAGRQWEVSLFASEDEADEYATRYTLYPRVG